MLQIVIYKKFNFWEEYTPLVHHLDINHLPEPSEVHGGRLLLPLAELTVIHQARKLKKTFKSQGLTAVRLDLMESLGHNESALTYRRAN